MIGLDTVGRRFHSVMRIDGGLPFYGMIVPLRDQAPPSYDFSENRTLLRTRAGSGVTAGSIILDQEGRRFIVGLFDTTIVYGRSQHETWRLYPTNKLVTWSRESQVIDPLTKLGRSTGVTPLGTFWALVEPTGRERPDNVIKVAEETRRIITGADIQLGDMVDSMRVKRVDQLQGIKLGELF